MRAAAGRSRARVALVTDRRGLMADDAALVAPCAARGIEVVPACWDDPSVRWGEFARVVLRSPWDYHERFSAFEAWLDGLEGVALENPLATVRRNLYKRYLVDLAAAGVPVVPTVLVPRGARLAEIAAARGWDEVVVKPEVSAGSWRTSRGRPGGPELGEAQGLVDAGASMLMQPFLRDVLRLGEWSLVYMGGRFSHALRKIPTGGSFYVQEEHGGRIVPAEATCELKAVAERVLAAWEATCGFTAAPLLYARVDLLPGDGEALLGELELVEPSLYLRCDEGAAERFAEVIAGAVG